MENNIIRVIRGTGFKTKELTKEELDELENEYIEEAKRIHKKATIMLNDYPNDALANSITDKILSPFIYFVQDKLTAEALNERKAMDEVSRQPRGV